jgi:hypothetical protein
MRQNIVFSILSSQNFLRGQNLTIPWCPFKEALTALRMKIDQSLIPLVHFLQNYSKAKCALDITPALGSIS